MLIEKRSISGVIGKGDLYHNNRRFVAENVDKNRISDNITIISEDVKTVYHELFDRGVELIFLKEPHINSATYKKALQNNIELTGTNVDYILNGVNRYLLELAREQIRIAFEQSEKEVRDLRQRTREGIETARISGKQIGQKTGAKLNVKKAAQAKAIMRKHCKEFGGSLADTEVIRLSGVSRKTFYKYKRELRKNVNGKSSVPRITPTSVRK